MTIAATEQKEEKQEEKEEEYVEEVNTDEEKGNNIEWTAGTSDTRMTTTATTTSSKKTRQFPSVFYDPTTGELMKDPVVDLAGDSHERRSVISKTSSNNDRSLFYPNRALKAIIEREKRLSDQTLKGTVHRFEAKMQQGWSSLLGESAFAYEHRPLPDSYYCPISCDLILDPVITPDGISYEREAIENWIRVNGKSPMTRNPLALQDLRENDALYELIQQEQKRTEESMHPSIRRWRASGVASRRPLPQTRPSAPSAEYDDQPSSTTSTQVATTTTTATTTDQPVDTAHYGITDYPTTQAGIAERRRLHRRNKAKWIFYITITVIVVSLIFPYISFYVILISFAFCIGVCASNTEGESD